MWNVLDINLDVLVICLGENFQEAVGNTKDDSWIETKNGGINL